MTSLIVFLAYAWAEQDNWYGAEIRESARMVLLALDIQLAAILLGWLL